MSTADAPVPPPGGTGASSRDEVADLLDRLSRRLHDEVESADLPLLDGDTLRIACLAEVEQWLVGCAVRVRNGEPL